ncbi:MAG: alpha/beta fold hydrolase [Phycisphaeraceae bacterium]|nr:alpha/beta fold hydrolase [Phycisphaeraceae bacterium]
MPTLALAWGDLAFDDHPGSGTPLIFLHGSGCDSTDWNAVLRDLPHGRRSITLDFRGHGRSATPTATFSMSDLADDALSLADHLRLNRFILVGHSLGGMVAMDLASRCDRAASLVLLEGWTRLTCTRAFTGDRFHGTLNPAAVAAIQQKLKTTRDRFTQTSGGWDAFWQTVSTFDATAFLQSASIPIFEVYGDLGRTPDSQRLLAVPDNPHIQWHWLPGAGHYLPTERPQDVAALCGQAVTAI